ncbi:hypothetical protein ACSNO4_02995 [Kocuria flava]|uniref:hypothetical protein n=1 Tax=Kocuria flava TaxID=446860 RepID=UPI003F1B81A2
MPAPAEPVVAPVPALRVLLRVAAVLVFLAGVVLFVFPLRTADWFAWTVAPPMTAVFLGAAYWSSAVLEAAGARSAGWDRARLAVWPVLVFTTLTLGVTLLHLDRFHLGPEHPPLARTAAWAWLVIYALVPVAMLAAAALQLRAARSPAGPRSRVPPGLPGGLRLLLGGVAAVLVAAGTALLAVPARTAVLWPWELTPLTGRAVGAWLVGLGVSAALAGAAGAARTARPVAASALVFVLLQVLALLRHGDALGRSPAATAGLAAVLVAVGVAAVWLLVLGRASPPR